MNLARRYVARHVDLPQEGEHFQRVQSHPHQQHQGCHRRTRSLSSAQPGTWTLLQCSQASPATAVAEEYL
jgi:hypothetical protein